MIYIFDIDGTLADLSHRLHFITGEKKDWTGFFADCESDAPIPEVIQVARSLGHYNKHKIVMITGRSDEIRDKTIIWLLDHNVPCDGLYMRKKGDHREDCVVKAELLDELVASGCPPIAGVFEDRQQVVGMYRARGLRVFQVAPGNF
jgi:FMN phosphatase YigB (HAD superfamily)